jgi:hypothetical protein
MFTGSFFCRKAEGMTDRRGRVELRGRFIRSGGGDTWHGSRVKFFTYSPWCVTVRADGYRDFRRALGDHAAPGGCPHSAVEPERPRALTDHHQDGTARERRTLKRNADRSHSGVFRISSVAGTDR